MEKELKELTPIKALRVMTGIIDPNQSIQILLYINLIARYFDKDPLLERDFLLSQFEKIGIKLVFDDTKNG